MADNFDDSRENNGDFDDFDDFGEFDLNQELEDLTSFLQGMGVELEDEETGDEASREVSFDFAEDGGDLPDSILDEFLSDPDLTVEREDRGPETATEKRADRAADATTEERSDRGPEAAAEERADREPEATAEERSDRGSEMAADATTEKRSDHEPEAAAEERADREPEAAAEEHAEKTAAERNEVDPEKASAGKAGDEKGTDLKKAEKEVDKVLRKTFGRPFSWRREVLSWVAMFLVAFALAFIIDNYLIVNATVPTGSMQNTIMAGDRMIGWRLSYVFSEPERGDIIIFEYPDDPEEIYVKRVIGLPGETVTITDGEIYINDSDEPLEEDYLPEEWVWKNTGYTFVVPEDSYLCLGDNRNNSHDARSWTNTYVTKDAILGRAVLCYWPLDDIGWLN